MEELQLVAPRGPHQFTLRSMFLTFVLLAILLAIGIRNVADVGSLIQAVHVSQAHPFDAIMMFRRYQLVWLIAFILLGIAAFGVRGYNNQMILAASAGLAFGVLAINVLMPLGV